MPTNVRDPFPIDPLLTPGGLLPSSARVVARPDRTRLVAAGATVLGVVLLTATVTLVTILWVLVGRPVEDLTGGVVDGLGATAVAFGVIAAPIGAAGVAIRRVAR